MNKVQARYCNFENKDQILQEQQRLLDLQPKELLIELKRMRMPETHWRYFMAREYELKDSPKTEMTSFEASFEDAKRHSVFMDNRDILTNWQKIESIRNPGENFGDYVHYLLFYSNMDKDEIAKVFNTYIDITDNSFETIMQKIEGAYSTMQQAYEGQEGILHNAKQILDMIKENKEELIRITSMAEKGKEIDLASYSTNIDCDSLYDLLASFDNAVYDAHNILVDDVEVEENDKNERKLAEEQYNEDERSKGSEQIEQGELAKRAEELRKLKQREKDLMEELAYIRGQIDQKETGEK